MKEIKITEKMMNAFKSFEVQYDSYTGHDLDYVERMETESVKAAIEASDQIQELINENEKLKINIKELEDSIVCLEQGTDSIVENIRYSISFLEKYL